MAKPDQVVFVIDDDPSIRAAIKRLLEAVGIKVKTFETGQEFFISEMPDVPACMVLDVRLPGRSGLDLQREMSDKGIHIPIIFIRGHGDGQVQALAASAIDFLQKPFSENALFKAINLSLVITTGGSSDFSD